MKLLKFPGRELLLKLIKCMNGILRNVVSKSHSLQMSIEWGAPPEPEWFDHYLDLYYQWGKYRNPLWLERGLFSMLALKNGGKVLELCCGDGFNAKMFYSLKVKSIISVDFDKESITHAVKYNNVDNVSFQQTDIRFNMPDGQFDNIVWDAAIEHFTETEIDEIMKGIKKRLNSDGVLSGYTVVKRLKIKSFVHHEYEFASKEDLLRFLSPYFKKVKIFETIYPSRHNLYFWASESEVPFDANWRYQIIKE